MQNNNSFEILIDKSKVIRIILVSIFFIIIGFWFVLFFATIQTKFSPMFVQILGIVSVIFFGFTLFYSILKYVDKKPGLVFINKGIVDNTNGTSVGLIEWNDITEIKVIEIWKTKAILLLTNKPEKYIEKASSSLSKIMRANLKLYGTPLSITPQTLKIDFEELLEMILKEFSLNKNQE